MRETTPTRQRDAPHDRDVTAVVFYLVTACTIDFLLYRFQLSPSPVPWFTSQALGLAFLRRLGMKFAFLMVVGVFINGYFVWLSGRSVPVVFLGIVMSASYILAALAWFPFDQPSQSWWKKSGLFVLIAVLTSAIIARLSWIILSSNHLIDPVAPLDWTWRLTVRDSLDLICTYPFFAINLVPLIRQLVYGRLPEDDNEPNVLTACLFAFLPFLAFAIPALPAESLPIYVFFMPGIYLSYRFGMRGATAFVFGLYFWLYNAWPYTTDGVIHKSVLAFFCLAISCFGLGKLLDQLRFKGFKEVDRRETQLKSLHRQLLQIEESRREWRSLTQTLERLVMRSTQDLRTPLTPIYIWSQMLKEDRSPKSVDEASEAIQLHIERQTRMLEELRDSVRISMGHQPVHMETFEMSDLLRELAATWREEGRERRIDFHYDRELPASQVLGDREQLSLALQKLFEHLLHFGKDDATISLHASNQHREIILHLKHSGYSSDQQHVIKLLQAGQGMDAESFLTAANFDLALYTARKLIDLQGGRLTAASLSPKPGMVFSLSLRRSNVKESEEPKRVRPEPLPRTSNLDLVPRLAINQRMLIVEDDPFTLHLLDTLLSSEGVETIPCANAVEAIEAFHQWQPSLVLADLGLPDINGFELMRRMKKAAKQDFHAIAFSACVTPEAQQQAIEAGFTAFLAKPLQAKDLWQTLQAVASVPNDDFIPPPLAAAEVLPPADLRPTPSKEEHERNSYGHRL